MSNAVDTLLAIDMGEIEMPKTVKKIYLKKIKKEIEFSCVALDPEKSNEIQMKCVDLNNNGLEGMDTFKLQALTVIEGCKDVFKNKKLMKHFNCPVPIELVRKLLLDGELSELYATVSGLSSYQASSDEEIKN